MRRYLTPLLCLALLVATAAVAVACGGTEAEDGRSPGPSESPAWRTKVELAPIDGVEIDILKSKPPQHVLRVTSGLPNGCARFDRYVVERKGLTIEVKVTNLMPADEGIACTEIYGTVEHSIPLGSDFEQGKTYTVVVNDVTKSFTAQ